jgi:hypothetical protein
MANKIPLLLKEGKGWLQENFLLSPESKIKLIHPLAV